MREFKKYQHLERFGTDEVLNIHLGETHIFPKIDGTNSSLWFDEGQIQAGSRTRHLTLEADNAGFYKWALTQPQFLEFFKKYGDLTLYGEWLVPHSLKTYRKDAWHKFYVFDVVLWEQKNIDSEIFPTYLTYNEYKPLLDEFNIDYIPPLSICVNGDYDRFIGHLEGNNYLIEDGKGSGEGLVIKNYGFVNKYGRTTWAKIVTSEFREKHAKEMGSPIANLKSPIEHLIIDEYLTSALVDKVFDKIRVENDGFNSRQIPQLLSTCFYELINEETWHFIKKHKNPTIDFSALQHLAYLKVKECLPTIFG